MFSLRCPDEHDVGGTFCALHLSLLSTRDDQVHLKRSGSHGHAHRFHLQRSGSRGLADSVHVDHHLLLIKVRSSLVFMSIITCS